MKSTTVLVLCLALLCVAVIGPRTVTIAQSRGLSPQCDPDNGGLTLPAGFCALVVSDGNGVGRHMVVAPNGDVFMTLRVRGETDRGGVVALRDTDGDGRFEVKRRFGSESSTGVALRNGFLYVAEDAAVVRYPIRSGELEPSGPPETLVTFARQRSHAAKGFAFDGRGGMYVNIGVPSNTCAQKEGVPGSPGQQPCPLLEQSGGIWRFGEDRPGQSIEKGGYRYATGLRQFYALEWRDGALYALQHGRDSLNTLFPKYFDQKQNAELPSEELLRIEEGANFGWPYCYHDWQQGHRVLAPEYGGDGKAVGECAKYTTPVAGYPGHWAPGDLHFYSGKQFPEKYRNGTFIAFQGSWNRAPEPAGGYKVVFQPLSGARQSGPYEVFADGFSGAMQLMRREDAKARPAGIAEAPDGSLYISDMVNGKIWRVLYKGDSR